MNVAEPLAQPPFDSIRCWTGRAETKVASEFRISGVSARQGVADLLLVAHQHGFELAGHLAEGLHRARRDHRGTEIAARGVNPDARDRWHRLGPGADQACRGGVISSPS